MISAPVSHVQTIVVTVDGEVVPFDAQPPIKQGGTVLVPLRGVFEKLGASVFYDASTHSIRAVKGTTEVLLHIGSTQASVNGTARMLSLPAQERLGATLVPLRFISEALGARVSWSPATETVAILSSPDSFAPRPRGLDSAPVSGHVMVDSLTHDARKALRRGDILNVTLTGTPGARATFRIAGIEAAHELPLTETAAGTYTGSFKVEPDIEIRNAPLFGMLQKDGASAPEIQAARPLTLDGIGPTFHSFSPRSDQLASPTKMLITGTITDTGTGIDGSSFQLHVNGVDVTAKTSVTDGIFSYAPNPPLPPGKAVVVVFARDRAGNEARREWSFQVGALNAPPPRFAAPQKPSILTPAAGAGVGSRVAIVGRAAPGATVRYRLTFQGIFLVIESSGIVREGEVRTDGRGIWTVPEISLPAPAGMTRISFTLDAVALDAFDARSAAARVTFHR